jgi:broad specificity phosphatase PhoE
MHRLLLLGGARELPSRVSLAAVVSGWFYSTSSVPACEAVPSSSSFSFSSQLPPLPNTHTKRVYLVRHGQTNWNKEGKMQGGGFDIDLNDTGKAQARAAAQCLSDIPLDVVASSHLSRAKATADAIFEENQGSAARVVDPGFGEMRFGGFEGAIIKGSSSEKAVLAAYAEAEQRQKIDATYKFPAIVEGSHEGSSEGRVGESPREVSQRAQTALEGLLKKVGSSSSSSSGGDKEDSGSGRHICIVAHGRVNKILLASLFHGDERQHDGILQGNTCINVLDWCEKKRTWTAVLVNYEGHTKGLSS